MSAADLAADSGRGAGVLPGAETWRRLAILGVVAALLVLAVVANATVKRHRAAQGSGAEAAVAYVEPHSGAQSTAWYCPGPLPLGLKSEHAFLAIANAGDATVSGEMLISTSTGLSLTELVSVGPSSTDTVSLPPTLHSTFAAASVLADGSGLGVEEVVEGPTGRQAANCATHTSSVQYLAGGSSRGANDVALALYDPGATPAVADVSFETSSGSVAPVADQGLPIGAGQVVVLDVGHLVAQREVIATTVTSTGGHLVVGAIERAAVGSVVYPALVSANAEPESTWYLPAEPAGGATTSYLYALNPSGVATVAHVRFEGSSGSALATLVVPAGGVARLTPGAATAVGALRFAEVTSSPSPLVILESNLLSRPLTSATAHPATTPAAGRHSTPTTTTTPAVGHHTALVVPSTTLPPSALPENLVGLPVSLPVGFALAQGTVAADGWVLPGGTNDATDGEFVTVANPGTATAVVTLETLAGGSADVVPDFGSIQVAPGQAVALDLSRVLPKLNSVTLLATSSSPILVGAGLYARGSRGSVGLSEPVAIPLD